MTTAVSIDVDVTRVLLRVSDIERATRFFRDVLGLQVVAYGPDFGLQAAFLTGGPRHHFLLTTWDGPRPQTTDTTGRAYVAIYYPTDRSFAAAIRHAQRAGCEVVAAWVHDDVQTITFNDFDGNAVRLSYDTRRRGEFKLIGEHRRAAGQK